MIIKTLNDYKNKKFKDVDLSNKYNDTYIEIPPFTKNAKGEWLNDSAVSKWVLGDKFNIDEYIQSFRDSVDLSKIIDLVTKTGDNTLLNRRQGFYADISDLPNDLNNFNDKVNSFIDILSGIDKDIAIKIINGDVSNEEIYKMLGDKYNVFNQQVNNENIEEKQGE